jgi:protein phosphatase
MGIDAMHWTSACRTHVGRVRELNEDACVELGGRGVWAVADGMGGHAAGEVASRMVVDALNHIGSTETLGGLLEEVRRALQKVNRELTEEARRRHQHIIGSTVAALLVFDQHCIAVWAGDSRVYLLRDGQLRQLTRDHSQVEEMIERGLISRQDAKRAPGANIITRAIGVAENVEIDAEIHDVRHGDTFLLCSDGLYNEVSSQDIQRILGNSSCQEAADRLVESALDHGARDNVTVVVVRADDSQITKTVFNPNAPRRSVQEEDEDTTKINQ